MVLKPIHEGNLGQELPEFMKSLYSPGIGVGYVLLANLISNLSLFYWLKNEFSEYQWVWDWKQLKSLWIYAYPLMLMSLAAMFNLMFDRLLLEELLPDNFYPHRTSQDALGIYGNCYKLSVFMSLAIQAFKYSAEPFFLGKKTAENSKENLALITHWFIIVCSFLWIGVSCNLFWIKKLFLGRAIYWEGIEIVPILLLANLFLGIYYTQSVWFKVKDKTYVGTIITLIGLLITLAGNVIFIPKFGYMACAWSFLASSIVMTVLCYIGGQIVDPAPYQWKKALTYLFLGFAAIQLKNFLPNWGIPLFFSENLGFLMFFLIVLWNEFSYKNGKLALLKNS
jgi:O-antigen/teichoic acid export membrane protein